MHCRTWAASTGRETSILNFLGLREGSVSRCASAILIAIKGKSKGFHIMILVSMVGLSCNNRNAMIIQK